MEPLLSQDEIDALFSIASYRSSKSDDPREARGPDSAAGPYTPCITAGLAVDKREEFGPEIQNLRDAHGVDSSVSAVEPAEVRHLSVSLHESLSASGILQSCMQVLRSHVSLGRISLVQPRSNSNTATIHSLDGDRNASVIGPQIIEVDSSRLRECLLQRREMGIWGAEISRLDYIERGYLLDPELKDGTISLIYKPLLLERELKGVLVLCFLGDQDLGSELRTLFSYITPHLSLAIANAELYSLEKQRSRRLLMILDIAAHTTHQNNQEKYLNDVCQSICINFGCRFAQIWVETRDRLNLVGQAGNLPSGEEATGRIPVIAQECVRQNQVIRNNNIRSEFVTEPNCEGASQLAVPIDLRGKCLGVLFMEGPSLDFFVSEDVAAMERISSFIAARLQNSQAIKNSERSRDYLQSILESMHDWAILSTDVHGYVFTCSVGSKRIFNLSQSEILGKDVLNLFTDPKIQAEIIAYLGGNSASPCLQRFRVPQMNGAEIAYLDVTLQQVHNNEGYHIGFLCVIRNVTDRVFLERKLKKLTVTDDVTGLYNQRGFYALMEAEVKRCRKSSQNFSLCFMDLDGLKRFNDTYGHIRGSRVLEETATLLKESVRPQLDLCCRYGGDEFVVIMPQMNKVEAQVQIERIRIKLSDHFHGKITASFGITDFSDYNLKATDMLARADKAMYRAKSQGKNCVMLSE